MKTSPKKRPIRLMLSDADKEGVFRMWFCAFLSMIRTDLDCTEEKTWVLVMKELIQQQLNGVMQQPDPAATWKNFAAMIEADGLDLVEYYKGRPELPITAFELAFRESDRLKSFGDRLAAHLERVRPRLDSWLRHLHTLGEKGPWTPT